MDHQMLPSPHTVTVPLTRRTSSSPSPSPNQPAPPMVLDETRLESKWIVGKPLYCGEGEGEKPVTRRVMGTVMVASSRVAPANPFT